MTKPDKFLACAECGQRHPEVSKTFRICLDCQIRMKGDEDRDDEEDFDNDYFDAKING